MAVNRIIKIIVTSCILVTAITATTLFFSVDKHDIGDSMSHSHIRCAIDLGKYDDSLKALTSGYNYALLKDFATDLRSTVDIRVRTDKDQNFIDSLRQGRLDIVVCPTSFRADSVLCSQAVDGLALWVVRDDNILGLQDINGWIDQYLRSDRYHQMHKVFVRTFNNPFKVVSLGMTRDNISPYDDIFRKYSPELGWDWMKLAAMVYKESKFRIDAHSPAGAIGLMQMMPGTVEKFNSGNAIDPEDNIRTAVDYLKNLQRIFEGKVRQGDSVSLTNFVFASYNAGEGHILDCISYARYMNVYDSTWTSIEAILPEMASDEIAGCEAVKLGKFKSKTTGNYVIAVNELYEAFRKMCH